MATRQDNPKRYGEIEQLAEDVLKIVRGHLEKKSWTREARLEAINALAWAVAFICHGSSTDNPFDLYHWFDDLLWDSVQTTERIGEEMKHD